MLLHRPPDRRLAGDSSPTTSSTATAHRPSSTAPDEDPLSISSSRRISRPVLHLQGAAPTFASSIAPPQSPQRHLDLPHRNRSTLTNSSDEAEANSAPPRRFCTHRYIFIFYSISRGYRCSIPSRHGVSPSTAPLPATSSTTSVPHVVASSVATSTTALVAAAPALAHDAALFLLSVALLHCSCFRSCCCSALALACAAAAAARPPAATGVAALSLAHGATA